MHFGRYSLLPERKWEADMEHLESLIDERTAALVVTNPSNPCGSVYSRQHILQLVALARRYKLPIIADEIYCDFVSTAFALLRILYTSRG